MLSGYYDFRPCVPLAGAVAQLDDGCGSLARDVVELRALAIGLRAFRGECEIAWNYMMAVALIKLAPILVLFFMARRHFVQGIFMTGIKG